MRLPDKRLMNLDGSGQISGICVDQGDTNLGFIYIK